MTEEQQRLVVDNMKLVPWVIHHFNYVRDKRQMDDLMGDGYVALCQAAVLWDSERGVKFSTYAARSIRNWLSRGIAYRECKKRAHNVGMISLDHQIGFWGKYDGKRSGTFGEAIADPADHYEAVEASDLAKHLMRIAQTVLAKKNDKVKKAYELYLCGATLKEIGIGVGVTFECARQYIESVNAEVKMLYDKGAKEKA